MFNSFDCVFLDLLFIDEAWNTIYNSQVNKTITDTGYDLDMSINMNTYCEFVMDKAGTLELGAEGLFGDNEVLEKNKSEGVAKLKISMNSSNQISSLILDVTSFSTVENQDQTKLTVEKILMKHLLHQVGLISKIINKKSEQILTFFIGWLHSIGLRDSVRVF